ncbi:gamma-glutamylcyclotransferase a [Girardinichthys multiradiatus]|uniref:gamma-glutamylcyclotransferase a n=1 Tax=Girardinichthys multiradiatus TaxID=208333 RepID=UPI001FAC4067|nr:gamma-glutamylcyclotransferase a [Girardinichthys multiradiatus]
MLKGSPMRLTSNIFYTSFLICIHFSKMSGSSDGKFMYFAFGSNLLKERLQLMNPSAVFYATGRLKDYKLDFGLWEKNVETAWHGGVATIESCPGEEVWGVVWTLSNENLSTLDSQEGVSHGKYSPLEVSIETDQGVMPCRTYQMNNFHACPPSPQYKQVVCLGAEQNGLPQEYLKRLEAIQTNNYIGPSVLDQIRVASEQPEISN